MWPFGGASNPSGSTNGSDAPLPERPSSSMEVPQGPDGVAKDVPVIAYTEQVIAEKEASLRKYIQDNYAKLQAVEKELEALRMEVKLTSGSKKAAMELLRHRIEESAEKIKVARVKEQQAKLAWEAAAKVVEDEEAHKAKLCDDLRLMVQWSALQQFERLESLTKKLDALNPEMKAAAMPAIEGLRAQIAPHGAPIIVNDSANGAATPGGEGAQSSASSGPTPNGTAQECPGPSGNDDPGKEAAAAAAPAEGSVATPKEEGGGDAADGGRGKGVQLKGHTGRGRGKKGQVKGRQGQSSQGTGDWTGAGFDVDAPS